MSVLSILFMSGRYDAYSISKAGDWHGGLARGNGDHQQIPHYQKWGWGSDDGHMIDGGCGMRQGWRWGIVVIIVNDDNVGGGNEFQNRIPPCQKWGDTRSWGQLVDRGE